jgi:peptidoglycan/xylan/chitin deacetylase (PgdA/CDA1 family)
MIERPVPWPNNAQCAVAITFDIDTDSFIHLEQGARVPDMVATTSWLRYDEVAVPRILRMFKEYGLRQTFFYPAWCMENYPNLVEAILKDGHEIAHHSWLHERPNQMAPEDELAWLQKGSATILRMTGQKPRGYRAPLYDFSKSTAGFLASEGFLYDASLMADDVPYVITTEQGSLIELPTHWSLDDWPQYVHNIELAYTMSIRSPDEAMGVYLADFEAAYACNGLWITPWHPWVSGRLARCQRIAKMIEYMLNKGGVWFATMEEIALHMRSIIADGSYEARSVRLPYYDTPIGATDIPKYRNPGA